MAGAGEGEGLESKGRGGVSLGVNNSADLDRTVQASVHEWSCQPAQQMALADRSSAYIQMKGR